MGGVDRNDDLDAEKLVTAENEYYETKMRALLIMTAEAIGWSIPVFGKVVGSQLVKLLSKGGALLSKVADGSLKFVNGVLHLDGKVYNLAKYLDKSTLLNLGRVFKTFVHINLAKASKVSVNTLIELERKMMPAEWKAFKGFIQKNGRKGMESISCRTLSVLGPSTLYVAM